MLQRVNVTNEKALEALQQVDGIMTQVEDGRWFLVEHDVCGSDPLEGLGVGFLSTSRRHFTDDIYKSIDNKEGETFWVPDDFADCDEIEDFLARNDYIYIKVYCYDHGGLSLSRGSVCSWDSYPFGYLYLDKRQVREIFQVKRLSKKTLERAEKLLDGVLKEFDDYINGAQYNVRIFSSPDMKDFIDSHFVSGYSDLCDFLEKELSQNREIA